MITHDADPAEYFGMNEGKEKGDPAWIVSRSDLLYFLPGGSRCPAQWLLDTEFPDTRSIRLGSLVDCLVLTPERFGEWYVICPREYPAEGKKKGDPPTLKPWNNNSIFCKSWKKREAEGGKTVVTGTEIDEARAMADTVLEKPVPEWGGFIRDFIEASQPQTMVVADIFEEATQTTVPCRALIDVCPEPHVSPDSLWDLKTTRDPSPDGFGRSVGNFHYDLQAAFYLGVYNATTGEERDKFGHLCVGNLAPYMASVCQLSTEYMEVGRNKMAEALANYCRCVETGKFHGWDGINVIEPKPWEMQRWGV